MSSDRESSAAPPQVAWSDLPRVPCAPGTVVIGDLHLDLFDGAHLSPFTRWLEELGTAPRLVILGDLFEFWVGRRQQRLPDAARVLAALRSVVERGTAIDVLHGNRDFLLDRHFEAASGATVRPDGLIGEHTAGGGATLFLHGDELCTGDLAYQRLRRTLRARPVRWIGTHLPFALQRRIAARLRRASERAVARKPVPEKSMKSQAADAALGMAGVGTLVCGHAHVFRDEGLPGGGRWMVIDGWGGRRDALALEPRGTWRPFAARPGAELAPGSAQERDPGH